MAAVRALPDEESPDSKRASRAAKDDATFFGVSADVVERSDRRHADLDEIAAPSVINQDLFSPNQDQIAFTISHVLNQD